MAQKSSQLEYKLLHQGNVNTFNMHINMYNFTMSSGGFSLLQLIALFTSKCSLPDRITTQNSYEVRDLEKIRDLPIHCELIRSSYRSYANTLATDTFWGFQAYSHSPSGDYCFYWQVLKIFHSIPRLYEPKKLWWCGAKSTLVHLLIISSSKI